MPLGISDTGRLATRAIDGAARAADRREGSLVDGAADADLLVDARPLRAAARAALRQGRRLARRGRRAPGGSGWRAQHEFGAGRSARARGAHDARPARGRAAVAPCRSSRPRRTTTWQRLLGAGRDVRALPGADPWVRETAARIVACIPASGEDLESLLGRSASQPRREIVTAPVLDSLARPTDTNGGTFNTQKRGTGLAQTEAELLDNPVAGRPTLILRSPDFHSITEVVAEAGRAADPDRLVAVLHPFSRTPQPSRHRGLVAVLGGDRHLGPQPTGRLGVGHHELRVLGRDRARRHADLGDPLSLPPDAGAPRSTGRRRR